jgi:hypothetical protein
MYAGRDRIIVTDFKENLDKITKVLDKLDVRPQVLLVEATILTASLQDDAALGVDLQILHEPNRFPTAAGSSAVWPHAVPGNVNNDFDMSRATMSLGTSFGSSVPVPSNNFGSMSFGIIANNIAAFVTAMEGITDTTVVANPKILILNKMQGTIHVGTRLGYVASVTQTTTSATADVKFLNVGTVLLVRPHICRDGFIRMEIQPKDSTGEIKDFGEFAVPEENVTQVTTNLMVRDGHTIVIGGLFRENLRRQRGQVPAIGNLPLIGPLFRNRSDDTEREEVMLLLTPHILHQADDEVMTKEIMDRAERIRLGARRGISWYTSRRQVDTFLLNARRHLAGGNIDRALWNVNMALAAEPTRHEAVSMKNRLKARASWTKKPNYLDTQSMVKRMIMLNQDAVNVSIPSRQQDIQNKHLENLLKQLEEEAKNKQGFQNMKIDTKPKKTPAPIKDPGEGKNTTVEPDKTPEKAPAKTDGSMPDMKVPEAPVVEAPPTSSSPTRLKEDVKIPDAEKEPTFDEVEKTKDNVSTGEAVTEDEKNYYFIIDM